LARAECPAGKTPALLLTADETAVERTIETDDEYVLVVNIRRYLATASGDAAASYYGHLRQRITQSAALQALDETPELLGVILENHLTVEVVERWARSSPDRLASLREVAAPDGDLVPIPISAVVRVLRELDDVPSDVWQAILDLIPSMLDDERRKAILQTITADPPGRLATGSILAARIAERISDTRDAVERYDALIGDDSADETALQGFIQEHPWMIGLDYVAVRPKALIPRGQLDFCLERFDGFYDVLELKGPNDPIVSCGASTGDVPPPPSSYRLSPALANALGQVHVYRHILAAAPDLLRLHYGLRDSRDPRFIIVIGRVSTMTEECRTILHQLNLSLHRIEVMPYDVLGQRADGWLSNIEKYLYPRRPRRRRTFSHGEKVVDLGRPDEGRRHFSTSTKWRRTCFLPVLEPCRRRG
jgi:hypothetical protein